MFVLSLLIVPIYIGFLSHSYRHFFQGGIDVDELRANSPPASAGDPRSGRPSARARHG